MAFQLLPRLAWLGLSIADRQRSLRWTGAVVRNAVSAAIDAGQYETAVEWMDQGHSVIWGQLLQLRTPVNDLRRLRPDLANQFTILSKKLEGASAHDEFRAISSGGLQLPSFTDSSECYHDLAVEWDKLVQNIRALDGFDRFLLPQKYSWLQTAAHNGPVISINISQNRCDALVLMPDLNDILHIPLPCFTLGDAEVLHKHLGHLVGRGSRCILHDPKFGLGMIRNDIHSSNLWEDIEFEHVLS